MRGWHHFAREGNALDFQGLVHRQASAQLQCRVFVKHTGDFLALVGSTVSCGGVSPGPSLVMPQSEPCFAIAGTL